jgi:hypothetical protein
LLENLIGCAIFRYSTGTFFYKGIFCEEKKMAVKVKKKAVVAKRVAPKGSAVATKKVAAKKPVVKKKAPAGKTKSRAVTSKGDLYICEECGLIVTVDEMCDCVGVCDIICCGEPMRLTKSKAAKK